MDGYMVDFRALQDAAAGVNGVLDDVSAHPVDGIPHDASAVGHEALAATLSDFLDRWQRGVSNLASDGRQIAERLTANVNAYTEVEERVSGLFTAILRGAGADPGVH
jgi:hypothetical protein